MIFHLYLLNEITNKIHVLDLKPYDNVLGKAWESLLKEAIDSNDCWLVETDRLYHLNNEWTKENIIIKMQECIDTVNMYEDLIDTSIDGDINQDLMNYLHTFFEKLRGKDEDPPKWYLDAPRQVKDAVSEFNVLIHRYEAYDSMNNHAKITVGYKHRPTREMTLEEKKCFNLDLQPGEVYLKYCHKGKDLLDVFKDQDEHIGDENILPQHKISSDFNINFSWTMQEKRKQEFYRWLEENKSFLKSINIDINDPSITIGRGAVGKVLHDNMEELKKEIFGVTKIHNITYTE
ncbi:MAG: hypothetical protein RLZZ196_926 [Bacteroidota bacterium]|jgi:hypothetical protein